MRYPKLLPAFLLALAAGTAQAAVYKWVDEQGRVHYGARPPASVESEELRIQNRPASPAPTGESTPREGGGDTQPPPSEESAPEVDPERQAARRENCEIAKRNVDVLRDPANRRFRDPEGNVSYYTDEQREERIAQAQTYLDENCKDPTD